MRPSETHAVLGENGAGKSTLSTYGYIAFLASWLARHDPPKVVLTPPSSPRRAVAGLPMTGHPMPGRPMPGLLMNRRPMPFRKMPAMPPPGRPGASRTAPVVPLPGRPSYLRTLFRGAQR